MKKNIIFIDRNSKIPLFGMDFVGIIDRGTNVIEIKPITICNLQCKYCFVSAGDYETNFIIEINYLIENVKKVIEIKGTYDIEIHLAPYGEILLYPLACVGYSKVEFELFKQRLEQKIIEEKKKNSNFRSKEWKSQSL